MKESAKANRGFMWWGIFLAVSFGPHWLYSLISNKKYEMLQMLLDTRKVSMAAASKVILLRSTLDLLGFVFCIFACVLWYQTSKAKPKRKKIPHVLGYALFMATTFCLPLVGMTMENNAGATLNNAVSNEQFVSGVISFPLTIIAVCVTSLTVAYLLQFNPLRTPSGGRF